MTALEKQFLNQLYHEGLGKKATGRYLGCDFFGTISGVRVAYGGDLSVSIDFDDEDHIFIGGSDERDSIILSGTDFLQGGSGISENLHIYM